MNGEAIRRAVGLLVAGLVVAGCDGGEGDPSIAKALETKSDMEVAAAAVAEKKQEEAKAAKAAAEAVETAREAELASAAKLPAEMPPTLEKACDAFVAKYDEFMLAGGEKEVLQWWDGHRKKLGEARSKCLVRESIEVAACGTEALGAELTTLADLPRTDVARRVVEACISAHGKDA
jgi:hypothetical protein